MPEVMSIEVDEEFDPRPPAQPFGLRGPDGNLNVGLIAGIVVGIILVIALIVVVANPFGSDPKPTVINTFSPTDPLKDSKAIPLYSPNDEVVQSLQKSLESWALYYTTGDLDDIQDTFDLAGKQYAALLKEQPSILAAPEPGQPSKIELGTVGNVGKQGNLYTLRADITWTKPGDTPSNYKWDVVMKRDNNSGDYLLSTTKTSEVDSENALSFCEAVKVVTKLQDDTAIETELKKIPGSQRMQAVKDTYAIRLKVWKFVQPAFDESKAPDSVATIVDQYEQMVKILEKSTSLAAFNTEAQNVIEDDTTLEAYDAAADAANTECGADITGR